MFPLPAFARNHETNEDIDMTSNTFNKNSTKAWDVHGDGDTWTLGKDATLHVFNEAAVTIANGANDNTLVFNGDVVNTGSASLGIFIGDSANNHITFGANARFQAVTGCYGMTATGTTVVNGGDLDVSMYGIVLGADSHVTNSGHIGGYLGVLVGSGSTVVNKAGGEIFATLGISFNADGNNKFINAGFLGGSDVAVSDGIGNTRVVNTGRIDGNVTLNDGNDVFDTHHGHYLGTVSGGLGNDTFIISSKINIAENANEGTDTVKSTVSYALGDNLEHLVLMGKGDINGVGNADDNVIYGNAGANKLNGGLGEDVLHAGAGADMLTGGAGADRFDFAKGNGKDTVIDFENGTDHIGINFSNISAFSQLEAHFEKHGTDTWIDMGKGDTLVLQHTAVGQLDSSDFSFAAMLI